MIKHLITGGCSFSYIRETSWIHDLEKSLRAINTDLTCEHTGYSSQGQELIQKKVMLALSEALEQGLKPEEILVVVMWSGTYRKSWYIDNPDIINSIVKDMPKFVGGMSPQFLDLKNRYSENPEYFYTGCPDSKFPYNREGGWYFTVNGSESKMDFIQQHYLLDRHPYGVGKVHLSLENIVMLQNFCSLKGVKFVQQFFMDFVYEDIEQHKDHQIINYLYKQLNFDCIIKEGEFEYIHSLLGLSKEQATALTHDERRSLDADRGYFSRDGFHPGPLGSNLWTENVLVPFLRKLDVSI